MGGLNAANHSAGLALRHPVQMPIIVARENVVRAFRALPLGQNSGKITVRDTR
jgi:hypothetical protein